MAGWHDNAGEDILGSQYPDAMVCSMLKGEENLPFEGKGSSDFVAGSSLKGVPARAHNVLRHLIRRNPVLRMAAQDVRDFTCSLASCV